MSLAITHFAVGASVMTIVTTVWFTEFRYRQTLVVISGMWGLLPDLHYVSPILQEPLSQLKFTVIGNLFWFHQTMDTLEAGRGSRAVAGLAVGLLFGVTIASEYVNGEIRSG